MPVPVSRNPPHLRAVFRYGVWLSVLFACLTTGELRAQRWDSTYVQDLPFRYRINGGLQIRNNTVDYSTGAGESFELVNRRLAFRIGGRYRFASYTFSIPISDLGTGTEDEEGTSWGLGLRLYRRYGYFRTQFRFTEGFRLNREGGETEFRNDIKLFTAYLYAYHLLSDKKYSLRSSYNQRDKQLKSGGSWLAGGLITRRRLEADGLEIRLNSGERPSLTRFAYTTLGAGGGYAFTQLIKRDFFVTPLLYVGPELRFTNTQEENEGRRAEAVQLGVQARFRMSVGYHSGHHFIALIGDYTPRIDNSEILDTRDVRRQLELRIGTQW